MSARDTILDALAWAGITEDARIAKIAAGLVRGASYTYTKTAVREAVKITSPPYGRGKAIFTALWGDMAEVSGEIMRQKVIYDARQEEQAKWRGYLAHRAKRENRINSAYASAFSRPDYLPARRCPVTWSEYDARCEWEKEERERDKGDDCTALTHQDSFVVCLVISENGETRPHIATRYKRGDVVRTYLRMSGSPMNLAEAAISLGGPKVKAALAKGKRVKTDWIGRRTYIYHDGSDHIDPRVEELPWRTSVDRERTINLGTRIELGPSTTMGDETRFCPPDSDGFNDFDSGY